MGKMPKDNNRWKHAPQRTGNYLTVVAPPYNIGAVPCNFYESYERLKRLELYYLLCADRVL